MRRKRKEEGGELIESEQRISRMAYSSFGSRSSYSSFFPRASPPSPRSRPSTTAPRSSRRPSQLLVPSSVRVPRRIGGRTPEVPEREREREKERKREREREKEAFLCLCAHGSRSYIAYNAQRQAYGRVICVRTLQPHRRGTYEITHERMVHVRFQRVLPRYSLRLSREGSCLGRYTRYELHPR